jgi:stage II sporulation protein GA (sporulation sigma-E factor processing peptidase)|nr:sigma-E processing peptidase SpoIIGA [Pseudoclostridium thermosuccinogenes]
MNKRPEKNDCEVITLEVYIDILFLENIVMNYMILWVTARFSKAGTSSLRLFLGALVGAVYVVVLILFPGIKVYYTTMAKVILSALMVAISFSIENFRRYFKILAIFYVSTFIFAGAAFSFLYLNKTGGFVKNGVFYVYWQSSKWTFMIFSILTVVIIGRIFWEEIQSRLIKDKLIVRLKVAFENKIADMSALIDTGNSLHDPLTNMPVVIVEFLALKDILPFEIQSIFENSKENDLSSVTDIVSKSNWFSRFRLIPFNSLGKENGMLIGFKPDYIELEENEEKKGVENVIIGIYNRSLSKNAKYRALLSPELIS